MLIKATPHKACAHIAPSDFSLDCTKTENMQARCVQKSKNGLCAVLPYFQQSLYPVIRKYYVTGQAGSGIAL